jgi:hypothetical protein
LHCSGYSWIAGRKNGFGQLCLTAMELLQNPATLYFMKNVHLSTGKTLEEEYQGK